MNETETLKSYRSICTVLAIAHFGIRKVAVLSEKQYRRKFNLTLTLQLL